MPSKTNILKDAQASRIPRYSLRSMRGRQATTERSAHTQQRETPLLRTHSESVLSSLASTPGDVTPRVASPETSVGKLARSYSDVLMARIPPMPGALGETPARPRDEIAESTPSGGAMTEPTKTDKLVTPVSKDVVYNKNKPTFEMPEDCGSSQDETSDDAGDDQR
jgi:hypothetical protein